MTSKQIEFVLNAFNEATEGAGFYVDVRTRSGAVYADVSVHAPNMGLLPIERDGCAPMWVEIVEIESLGLGGADRIPSGGSTPNPMT